MGRFIFCSVYFASAGIKQRILMFLLYPETLTRTIGEGGFEQLANAINFRVFGVIIR